MSPDTFEREPGAKATHSETPDPSFSGALGAWAKQDVGYSQQMSGMLKLPQSLVPIDGRYRYHHFVSTHSSWQTYLLVFAVA